MGSMVIAVFKKGLTGFPSVFENHAGAGKEKT
jgi:hypothetical protein